MQTANIMLRLGGDAGNTVPKYGVTASEIAVLRVIHGDDAVVDIDPLGEAAVKLSHRAEIQRLGETYGRMIDGSFVAPAVSSLFPGAAARCFETIKELDLDPSFFVPTGRATAMAKWDAATAVAKADAKPAKPLSKKAAAAAALAAAAEAAAAADAEPDDDEGIGDAMPDANLFA